MGFAVNAEPDTDKLRYTYGSMTTPTTTYELDVKTKARTLLKETPVIGYDKTIKESSGRLYLDPQGEKLSGGLVKAPKMTSTECHKKYG